MLAGKQARELPLDIYATLAPIMREVFDDDALQPAPEMTAEDVRGWDSLAHIRLVLAVEEVFGVRFATPEVSTLANVGELVALIQSKLGGSAGAARAPR
jgi:acyl carrier protein